jgi:hypothetical protein
MGRAGRIPLILYLDATWIPTISFTLRPLDSRKKSPVCPKMKVWVSPRGGLHEGKEFFQLLKAAPLVQLIAK